MNIRILDGGMGRELKRMGAPFRQPEWSALALMQEPDCVRKVHDAFIQSGAQIITTNSYAVVPFHIGQERFDQQGEALARLSGELARASADASGQKILVAGSLPPMASYRADLFVLEQSLIIHSTMIKAMDQFVDIWLAETQSSIAEVRAIHQALAGNAKPLWISFTLDDEPEGEQVILRSGESVSNAVQEALALGAEAILFNCSQPEMIEPAIIAARKVIGDKQVGIGAYANAFPPQSKKASANAELCDIRQDLDPLSYSVWAKRWVDQGANIVGGCCGIGPEHIAELKNTFSD